MNQKLTRSPTVQYQLPRKCPVQLLLLCPNRWRNTDAITHDSVHWHWLASSENPSYIVQTKQISPALKVSAPPTLSKVLKGHWCHHSRQCSLTLAPFQKVFSENPLYYSLSKLWPNTTGTESVCFFLLLLTKCWGDTYQQKKVECLSCVDQKKRE